MPELETTPAPTTRPKRTRKPSKPRAPRVKDEAILAIENEAAEKKAQYRLAQQSGGILKRIVGKMIPRLTEAHRQALYDGLSKTVTPPLIHAGSTTTAQAAAITADALSDWKESK